MVGYEVKTWVGGCVPEGKGRKIFRVGVDPYPTIWGRKETSLDPFRAMSRSVGRNSELDIGRWGCQTSPLSRIDTSGSRPRPSDGQPLTRHSRTAVFAWEAGEKPNELSR